MQFHRNIDVHIYSYLHDRVFLTIITLLFILYCMTKLYITNDLIYPGLIRPVDQPASRDFDTTKQKSLLLSSITVISHTGNFNSILNHSVSMFFHLLFFHSLCCKHRAISKYRGVRNEVWISYTFLWIFLESFRILANLWIFLQKISGFFPVIHHVI